jgi:hypothetical protein
MNERFHRYLDGEISREELTPEDIRELAAVETIVSEVRQVHRAIEVPDLTARVMAQLPAIPTADGLTERHSKVRRERLHRAVNWMWAPRAVRFRPVYGVLAAAAVFVLMVSVSSREVSAPSPVIEGLVDNAALAAGKVFVQFRLDAPQASEVRLAGSFTDWQPIYSLDEVSPGIWSILIPLEAGVHNYAFVVNGERWTADPAAPTVEDGFGGVNSRISVVLPNGPSRL